MPRGTRLPGLLHEEHPLLLRVVLHSRRRGAVREPLDRPDRTPPVRGAGAARGGHVRRRAPGGRPDGRSSSSATSGPSPSSAAATASRVRSPCTRLPIRSGRAASSSLSPRSSACRCPLRCRAGRSSATSRPTATSARGSWTSSRRGAASTPRRAGPPRRRATPAVGQAARGARQRQRRPPWVDRLADAGLPARDPLLPLRAHPDVLGGSGGHVARGDPPGLRADHDADLGDRRTRASALPRRRPPADRPAKGGDPGGALVVRFRVRAEARAARRRGEATPFVARLPSGCRCGDRRGGPATLRRHGVRNSACDAYACRARHVPLHAGGGGLRRPNYPSRL